jgi:preprotein translocase subunit YajC
MFTTEAFAQSAGGISAAGPAGALIQFAPIVVIFVIMYLLILRPQQQKQRALREMVSNLRRGDTVVTGGGLIGKIAKVDDTEVQVELAEGVRVKVVRSSITEVRVKGEPVKDAAQG